MIGLLRHQALAQVGAHGPAAGGGDGAPPLHVRAGAIPSPHQLRPQRGDTPARAGLCHRAVRARVWLLSIRPVLPQGPAVQNGAAEERLVVIDLSVEQIGLVFFPDPIGKGPSVGTVPLLQPHPAVGAF